MRTSGAVRGGCQHDENRDLDYKVYGLEGHGAAQTSAMMASMPLKSKVYSNLNRLGNNLFHLEFKSNKKNKHLNLTAAFADAN